MKFLYELLVVMILASPQFVNAQSQIQLFNQNNLDGWYSFDEENGKQANGSNLFSVEQKMIRLYGPKVGYLMSEQSFTSFQLTVDFRWNTDTIFSRKTDYKNSGVMYLIPQEQPDTLWPKGIQFQIRDGATGDFILLQNVTLTINNEQTEAGKSVVAKRFEDAAKPFGEWNTLVVTVKNGVIKQELNGKLVNEGNNPSVTEGRILLQYEGYPIDFKKVEIIELL